MFFNYNKQIINIFKNHFLSLNRILENKLLLNTIYLIFLISIFTLIIFNFLLIEKKNFKFLTDSLILEFIIWFTPTIVILFTALYSIKSTIYLNPFKNIYSNINPLIIEVVSLNWKWMFIFPIQKILTFNEICLPIFIPIKFILISNSIMNALCIPKIGCQLYCMTNCLKSINIIILKHGVSHGFSSNYNGIGFQKMRINLFLVNKKTFFYWINCIKNFNFFNIISFNKILKEGYFLYPKFFSIRNNKVFNSILKKK